MREDISPAHRPKGPSARGSSPYWVRIAGYAIVTGLIFAVLTILVLLPRIFQALPISL